MAVNFGILSQAPTIGARFMEGQQAAAAEQERNMLRQMQAEQMAAQRQRQQFDFEQVQEERRRRVEREGQFQKLADLVREHGLDPDDPKVLGQFSQAALMSGQPQLANFVTSMAERAARRREAAGEAARIGAILGPQQPGAAAPAVNALTAPAAPAVNALAAAPAAPPTGDAQKIAELERQRDALEALGTPAALNQAKRLDRQLEKLRPKEVAPSADMQGYATAKLEGFKGTFFDYKRQLAEAGRTPAQPREPAVRTTKVELADGSIGVMNLDTGEITPAKVGGQVAKGKPSAFAEKTAAQRKQLTLDIDRTISELTEVTKKGGLIDQATGSGIGRAADVAAGFFGAATPGAIAIGKLQPIADMVLKLVPRFEGPQSDKDTKSYREAAGQLADASLPNKIRKNAAIEILRLLRARKDQFVTQDMAAEGAPAAPAGGGFPAPPPAAIDALKQGQGTDAQFDAIFGPGAAARARGR